MTTAVKKPTSKRPKWKTNSPVVFAISAEQKKELGRPSREALNRACLSQASATDWYNISFRIKTAYYVALEVYEKETQDGLNDAMNVMLAVQERRPDDETWLFSVDELAILQGALDASDQIDQETTRRVQLMGINKTRDYLQQFVF